MTERSTQAEIQAIIEREKAQWKSIVNQIGRDRMEDPGVMGDWTFKDLAAHMNGWRDNTTRKIKAAAEGVSEPAPEWPSHLTGDDEINDWIYQENRDRGIEDVLSDSDASFDQLAGAIAKLSDDQLNDPDLFDWTGERSLAGVFVNGTFFGHYHEEHAADVQEFISRDN